MSSYCTKCKKKTESVGGKVVMAKNGRKREASACAVCSGAKSRFLPSDKKSSGGSFLGRV